MASGKQGQLSGRMWISSKNGSSFRQGAILEPKSVMGHKLFRSVMSDS